MDPSSSSQIQYNQPWLIGALTQFHARYPQIIRRLSPGDLSIEIDFYVEEMAIYCAQALLDVGITAIHRLDHPRTVSLQLPSLLAQDQVLLAQQTLKAFFEARISGSKKHGRAPDST